MARLPSRRSLRLFAPSRACFGRRPLTSLIALSLLLYLLIKNFPDPPQRENNTSADRATPNRDLDVHPHFLYRSAFRNDPDEEYEARLDEILRRIEKRVLRTEGVRSEQIWQIMLGTAPRTPDSKLFEERNHNWGYSIADDKWAADFIANELAEIPDLKALYDSYPYHVLRADLLRYLIMWYHGGYYADTDVWPARPISSCPPLQYLLRPDTTQRAQPNISLVLGVEIDEPYASVKLMRDWHWSRSYGFIQYNIWAPVRFSPFLRRAVARVLAHTRQHNARAGWLTGPGYDEATILEVTGPGVFTDAILDVLSETLPPAHPLVRSSVEADAGAGDLLVHYEGGLPATRRLERVTWAPFHALREPVWVDATEAVEGKAMGGLGVLPVSVWGNGQRHSGAEGFRSEQACINHRFGRSWKKGWSEYLFG